jgi:hypothetical protein
LSLQTQLARKYAGKSEQVGGLYRSVCGLTSPRDSPRHPREAGGDQLARASQVLRVLSVRACTWVDHADGYETSRRATSVLGNVMSQEVSTAHAEPGPHTPLSTSDRSVIFTRFGILIFFLGFSAPQGALIGLPVSFMPQNRLHLAAHQVADFKLIAAVPCLALGYLPGIAALLLGGLLNQRLEGHAARLAGAGGASST